MIHRPARLARKPRARSSALPVRQAATVRTKQSRRNWRKTRTGPKSADGARVINSIKLILTWVGIVAVSLMGIWLLIWMVIVPQKLFPQQTDSVVVITEAAPGNADTTSVILLRAKAPQENSQVQRITQVTPTLVTQGSRGMSRSFGILVDSVVAAPISAANFVNGAMLSTALPQFSLWQLLQVHPGSPDQAIAQLRQLASDHPQEFDVVSLAEIQQQALPPRFAPASTAECPVAISNTTTISGLAEETSQLLERSGVLVVRTASGKELQPQSKLLLPAESEVCQQLAERIAAGLEVPLETVATNELFEQYRAALLLELGTDWQMAEEPVQK